MKTSLKTFFLASFIATIGISSISADNSQMQAVVTKKSGKVEIQDSNNPGKWLPLEIGSTLGKGSIIQTGFKSEAELQIKGTTISLAPLSRLTFEQLVQKDKKDETKVYLDTGSIKTSVKKTEDRSVGFKVRSPVATASVRGTVLEVTNKFRSTDIKTHEGTVAVWKSKSNGAEISTTEEDSMPAILPKDGNSPQDISDGAPANAFTVTKGQTAGFASNGTTTSTQANATKTAFAFTTAATTTAASSESETSTSTSPIIEKITPTIETVSPKTGNLNISVSWE